VKARAQAATSPLPKRNTDTTFPDAWTQQASRLRSRRLIGEAPRLAA
jgi:hypothetical protein